jgi:O-antigen ligase
MKTLEWGIYLIVFCLPLYLVRFNIFKIPTTALELLIYILFILWLVKNFKFKEIKNLLSTHYLLLIAILLILIGVSVATFYSWNPRMSLGILKAWFIDPLLFFIVIISVIKNKEQIKKIFYSLIFSGSFVSVISLFYLFQGKLDASGRLQGIYNSPNYLAMYLAPILIIGLGLIVSEKDYSHEDTRRRPSASPRSFSPSPLTMRFGLREVFLVSSLFLFIVLLFTKSFGAFLGLIFAIIFAAGIYLYKKRKIRLFWIIIGLGFIILLIFVYFKLSSIQGRLSLGSRLEIWQTTWEVFKTYPITGIGPGTFSDYFPPYPDWGVPQPHNIYLAFLIQTGIFGFIGFIWLLIWFFKTGLRSLVTDYWLPITILMSAMIYVLGHGLIDTTYWKNDLSVFFWLLIGLMAVLKNNQCSNLNDQLP